MQKFSLPKLDDEIIFDIFLEILIHDLITAIAKLEFQDYKNYSVARNKI